MTANESTSAAPAPDVVQFCKAIGDETRLAILRRLSLTDLRGGDMIEWLEIPHNALSYHLKYLRDIGLVRDHRSGADARDIYYSLDLERLRALYAAVGETLHTDSPRALEGQPASAPSHAPLRVLFLCTHNSARSQLAQGLIQLRGGSTIVARSAGSEPTAVHPQALALLQEHGIDTGDYYAKPMAEVAGERFDFVITVCDRVRELCPAFAGTPSLLHWSIPDPVRVEGDAARNAAFRGVMTDLGLRIEHFLRLSIGDDGELPASQPRVRAWQNLGRGRPAPPASSRRSDSI
jgi:protein-tyrosine-phosphatase/DNA-binding transcriptional ArsR family regulator